MICGQLVHRDDFICEGLEVCVIQIELELEGAI
jgi:hypothetical protein